MTLVHGQQHAVHDTDNRRLRRVERTICRLEDWQQVVLADVARDSCIHDFLNNLGDETQV